MNRIPNRQDALQENPLRVLVIEDNQDLARLFCDLLEVMGCETEMTFNGRSGLESARSNPPDLVFCDVRLPGEMNGIAVAQAFRADQRLANIPLFAVTGFSGVDDNERALGAGFNDVFTKPVKFAVLQEVLKAHQNR
ncbi:MAG: multi-sensor hybrid histidine kinase [Noviherbaspirillum sp.]|nr:multi-sensor hybrid histidine kinase [Noviherbaspirillum sp.]